MIKGREKEEEQEEKGNIEGMLHTIRKYTSLMVWELVKFVHVFIVL